jgi:hypothetical protein
VPRFMRGPDGAAVLQQVKDAIAGGGMAAGETEARELMAVHYEPGYLSQAYLTAWECRVVALQHLGQHADAGDGFGALAEISEQHARQPDQRRPGPAQPGQAGTPR